MGARSGKLRALADQNDFGSRLNAMQQSLCCNAQQAAIAPIVGKHDPEQTIMANEKNSEAFDTARDMADKTARQTKDNVNRFQATVEDATGSFQASVQNGAEGYRELGLKAVDLSRSNANAHFDFLKTLFAAKSLDHVFEIQSSYLRDRSQAFTNQAQELSSLTQQAMTKSVKPLQGVAERRARA